MATITKRTTSSGETHYRVQVRLRGLPPTQATFTRRRDAQDWARQVEVGLRTGRLGSTVEDHTFAELLDLFERDAQPKVAADRHGYGGHLQWWRRQLGPYFLRHISPAMVRDLKQKLLSETGRNGRPRGRATLNRYVATLSTVLGLGVRLEWIEVNVARKVDKEKESAGRVRFLSRPVDEQRSELDRLLEACRASTCASLADLVVLAIHTGCRASELLYLRATDVHLSVGGFTVPAEVAKNGESRFVPLAGEANEVIERRLRDARPGSPHYLFGDKNGRPLPFPRKAWNLALRRARITNFRFHDLRHTHASYLAMLGATGPELKESLGHKSLAMVARYTHFANAHKRSVSTRLAAELADWQNGNS